MIARFVTLALLASLDCLGEPSLAKADTQVPLGSGADRLEGAAVDPQQVDEAADQDWELSDSTDQEGLGLLPVFAFGLSDRRMPIAPPFGGDLAVWAYDFDLSLGYRFCLTCSVGFEARLGGTLSYPVRLVDAAGRPIVEFGLVGAGRAVFQGPRSVQVGEGGAISGWGLSTEFLAGLGLAAHEVQYSRFSIDTVAPRLEGGVHVVLRHYEGGGWFPGQGLALHANAYIDLPPGRYRVRESRALDRSDAAFGVTGAATWRGSGPVVSFGGEAVLRWLVACGVLSPGLGQDPGASRSCDALGIGVQYDQSNLVGLIRAEGAGRDFKRSGLGFFLQWARSVDGI